MHEPKIVSHDDWLTARTALLAKEKDLTRLRDQLSQERRELPWEPVTKEYRFEGAAGHHSLADLFTGRSQLVIYHFMFPPEWDAGCPHCSFWADNFNDIGVHLNQRDLSFAAVSRAPYPKLAAYRQRMGWDFPWYSSGDSDFTYDYGVSFRPEQYEQRVFNYGTAPPGRGDREAVSVFARNGAGDLFHTYSAYGRGIDMLNAAYHYLDLTPKGRDEAGYDNPQFWVRRHDEY